MPASNPDPSLTFPPFDPELDGEPDRLARFVGYAILRGDWRTGRVTRPDWDDEPDLILRPQPGMPRFGR